MHTNKDNINSRFVKSGTIKVSDSSGSLGKYIVKLLKYDSIFTQII